MLASIAEPPEQGFAPIKGLHHFFDAKLPTVRIWRQILQDLTANKQTVGMRKIWDAF